MRWRQDPDKVELHQHALYICDSRRKVLHKSASAFRAAWRFTSSTSSANAGIATVMNAAAHSLLFIVLLQQVVKITAETDFFLGRIDLGIKRVDQTSQNQL